MMTLPRLLGSLTILSFVSLPQAHAADEPAPETLPFNLRFYLKSSAYLIKGRDPGNGQTLNLPSEDLLGGAVSLDSFTKEGWFFQGQAEFGQVTFPANPEGGFSGQVFQPFQWGGRVGYSPLSGLLLTLGYLAKALPVYHEAEGKAPEVTRLLVDSFPLHLAYSYRLAEQWTLSLALGGAWIAPTEREGLRLDKGGQSLLWSAQIAYESYFIGWRASQDTLRFAKGEQIDTELGGFAGYRWSF